MNTINWIDPRNRELILHNLLEQQEVLLQQEFISFQQIFFEAHNSVHRLQYAKKIIQENIDQFALLKYSLQYDESIKQALNFLDLCDLYQINLSHLPIESPIYREKSELIKLCARGERPYKQAKQVKGNLYPLFKELYHELYLSDFEKLPAFFFPQPQMDLKVAINVRQEVSGLLTEIKRNPHQKILILTNDNYSQIELQRQAQAQHVEMMFLDHQQFNWINSAFLFLLDAFENKNRESLLSFFRLNPFNDQDALDYLKAIDLYEFSLDELIDGSATRIHNQESLFSHELSNQLNLFNKFKKLNTLYAQRFSQINKDRLVESIFNFLVSHFKAEKENLIQLKQMIEESYPYLDYRSLKQVIQTTIKKKSLVSNVVVTHFDFIPNTHFDHLYFLGPYPSYNKLTGLFDEEYVKKVDSFPTLTQRITYFNQQMKNLLHSVALITFSFSQMDFSGKANELSFEIKQLISTENEGIWDIEESHGRENVITNLTHDTAQDLFYRDGFLYGSVSSLETYTTNSYQYFIERGLRIQSPNMIEISHATVGTLSHFVMEQLIKYHGKHYVNSSMTQIEELLTPSLNELSLLYPQKRQTLELNFNRLSHNLYQFLKSLRNYQNNTLYEPTFQEYRFDQVQLYEDVPIKFTGIIDRVDSYNNQGIIIDYKSSGQDFRESKIKDGQKLQLFTYAMILKKTLDFQTHGVFYADMSFSLKEPSQFKLGVTSFTPLEQSAQEIDPLSGLLLSHEIDQAVFPIGRKKVISFDYYSTHFHKLFQKIEEKLNQGQINLFYTDSDYNNYKNLQRLQETYVHPVSLNDEIEGEQDEIQ